MIHTAMSYNKSFWISSCFGLISLIFNVMQMATLLGLDSAGACRSNLEHMQLTIFLDSVFNRGTIFTL